MLARTALSHLRAKVPSIAARDVAQLSRQLRRTYLTPAVNTNNNDNGSLAAPLTLALFQRFRGYATATKTRSSSTAKKTTKKGTATKKKPAAKKRPTAKPKKKELTDAQKERLEKRKERAAEQKRKDALKELKATALQEPKQQPATVFSTMLAKAVKEHLTKGGSISQIAKDVSEKYKNLSPSELERYKRLANDAKEANAKAYKKWVENYTPAQIKDANNARRQLRAKIPSYRKQQIQDYRLVKQPTTAWILFYKDRTSSGDFKSMNVAEAAKIAGKEWKALSASEKQKYETEAEADKKRYVREYKSTYGEEPEFIKRASA